MIKCFKIIHSNTRNHTRFNLFKQTLQDFYYISFSDNSLGDEGYAKLEIVEDFVRRRKLQSL